MGKLCLPAEEALRTTVTLITFTAHKFDLLPAKNCHIGFYFLQRSFSARAKILKFENSETKQQVLEICEKESKSW